MLSQIFQRKVAKTQSRKDSFSFLIASLLLCVFALNAFLASCGSKSADLRSFIPADSLVYLESNDLGAVMNAITERPAFREAANEIPDSSVLNGVKLAVAVTGFETKEVPVSGENSVLNFTPRFVAVLETNAWNFQAIRFTEEKLGAFINDVYGGEVLLESSDKHDGKYYVWKADDGRRAFALVQGSVVFFGNDETAIERCLAVKRGEAESIAKNPKIISGDRLAFGYISPDGIAQIANIAGLSMAKSSSEEGEVQSFVARVLPEILRNSLRDATWTATKSDEGITDSFSISMNPEISSVLNETLVPLPKTSGIFTSLNFGGAVAVTRYNLRDPRLAWRSVLLSAGKATDPASGGLVVAFASSLFEPYGIENGEEFLSAVEPEILTVRFEDSGENVAVIAKVKDAAAFEQSIAKELRDVKSKEERSDSRSIRRSADGELMLVTQSSGVVIIGDAEFVQRLIYASAANTGSAKIFSSDAAAATYGTDKSATSVVDVITELKTETPMTSTYFTETRFNRNGIERRTISDFGFIGWVIEQFGMRE